MTDWQESFRSTVLPAVARSTSIDEVILAPSCLDAAGTVYRRHFHDRPALVIADETTYALAGERVSATLSGAGIDVDRHVLPAKPRLQPERTIGEELVERLRTARQETPIAVAVGSGVVHDLTRYAAFHAGTHFMSVPTAASMDGYTSAGAPLSDKGFKITLQCAPPRVILADLDVIAAAPAEMSGWGYGDLAGKMPAGGDWLVADALGVEPVDDTAWPLVQDNLKGWLADPAGVRDGAVGAIAGLFVGLAVTGLAMELHGSSRPASGADHQIAHIWEMEHLAHRGEKSSHGACVAIGCLSMLALYDWLIARDFSNFDPAAASRAAPDWEETEATIRIAFGRGEVAERAIAEMRGKRIERAALAARLERFKRSWPALRQRLSDHLMRESQMRNLLAAAGAPVAVGEIGLSAARHRATVLKARYIRKRYTLLDLLAEAGLLERAVTESFPDGHALYAGKGEAA
ncbi:sn-glycerol-1-phosphate dehydrogenase [Mesorhizobium sp. 1B3]|uniref:sn-glycerol-1-phosphate dehydrogenase n=1 Tax=Mesorhizobium sp. 1B3 TaxID=3243599 RepID=UPI003D984AC8